MSTNPAAPRRIAVTPLEERIGLKRCTIWRKYTAEPPLFPRPHYIGNRRFWFLAEIEEWERAQMARSASERTNNLQHRATGRAP